MKTKHLLAIALMLLFYIATSAQIGINTTTPDNSSMLDIRSSSKGLLIPRMSTNERINITSPATSLLVYDLDSESFWYFNSGWKELPNTRNIIEDDDKDTYVEVDHNSDNNHVSITTNGTQRVSIDASGNTRIGNGNNNTLIQSDGSLKFEGSALRWNVLKVNANILKKNESNKDPAIYGVFVNGLSALSFKDDKDRSVFFTVQLPHSWKEGTAIYPNVHWSTQTNIANPDTQGVKWSLEYKWVNVADNFNNPSSSSIITGQTVTDFNSSNGIEAYEHVVTPLNNSNGIDGTGKTVSSILIGRLYRDVSDAYSGNDVFLLEINFHYQTDSTGSETKFTK